MTDIASPTQVRVSTCGELVVLALGNVAFSMHFACALKVSLMLLEHGRLARRNHPDAGGWGTEVFHKIRGLASLHDATTELTKPSRWAEKPPEIYQASEIMSRVAGQSVELKFRGTVATLPYQAALYIAQHLRVRGKEARNSINETAPWHEIAGAGR